MIIVFNGPPRSGKDAGCEILKNNGYNHIEFKKALFDDVIEYYGVDADWFHEGYTREKKDEPEENLSGLSRRDALIYVSEEVRKPKSGQGYYGAKSAEEMEIGLNYCISDGGFVAELAQIINKFGKDELIFIRLYRDGSDYSNDSRRYIKFKTLEDTFICGHKSDVSIHEDFFFPDTVDVSGYIVHNNGGIEELYSVITDIVRTHNDRKNKKQIVQKDII